MAQHSTQAQVTTMSMTRTATPRTRSLLWVVLGLLMMGGFAQAQLMVQLEMTKRNYLSYEPLTATVVVNNRAGKDIVLGGPGGQGSWLTFAIHTAEGQKISAPYGNPMMKPTILEAGDSLRQTISLGKFFPLSALGRYNIKAGVWFEDFQQYTMSPPVIITVAEGSPFWEQTCGVPVGSGRVHYLRFILMSLNEKDHMSMFVRIKDERTSRVVACYSLGRMVPHRDPQATLDSQNRCHVLFLHDAKTFKHCVIKPDGQLVTQDIYQESNGISPELRMTSAGVINVRGGQVYDPVAIREAEQREVVRDLTDRPLGVPEYVVK
jgi:hypothetical protein